nr:40S ribosomal protein S3A [Seculamonas ecuadoriensis]
MAIGKNPQKAKYSKKGSKKKAVDAYARKEWYDIRAPAAFRERLACKTIVNRTAGTKIASEYLKGRVFEVNLGDLNKNETLGFRKMKLRVEDVQGKNCLTNFYGMSFTTDKLRSLVRKWHSLIEANIDLKTTDGFVVRMFCIAQTKRRPTQVKKTSYAQSSQVKRIRRKMFDIMTKEVTTSDLKGLVEKIITESIGDKIGKVCSGIYPLQNIFIRKVKLLKAPKFDITKLMDIHTGPAVVVPEDAGQAV